MGGKAWSILCGLSLAAFPEPGREPSSDEIARAQRVSVVLPPAAAETTWATQAAIGSRLALDSHPVLVKPAWAIPDTFPLLDGMIGCSTCHEQRGPSRAGELRGPLRGEAFCAQCHSQPGAPTIAHASALIRAHPSSREQNMDMRVNGLDAESQRCLICHDGTISDRMSTMDTLNGPSIGDPRASHPIGVLQPSVSRPNGTKGRYVPLSEVPDGIRLYNGRVGCGSCHNLYAKTHNYLVAERDRDLCFGCHDL